MKDNSPKLSPSASPPRLTITQLDEALEERINRDRRNHSKQGRAVADRRVKQRRQSKSTS